jgi:hypothetical protein
MDAQETFLRVMKAAATSHCNEVLDTLPQVSMHAKLCFTYLPVLARRCIQFVLHTAVSSCCRSAAELVACHLLRCV